MIHQLLCTHCTYGSSYLHQSTDEPLASQAFEYSARAGSVPREVSHDFFRRIQSALYYPQPRAAASLQVTAASTSQPEPPKRLVYFPSLQRLRVAAHVAFRTEDSQGRPRSYFAHVLFTDTDRAAANWFATDFLQLWGAPQWTNCEEQIHGFEQPTLRSLGDLAAEHPPIVCDGLVERFLSGSAADLERSRCVIPDRWIAASVEQRRRLLTELLASFLASSGQNRIVVAAEPDFAAVLFFALARMLPRAGSIVRRLSFSTFESDSTSPITTLAAVIPGSFVGRTFARKPKVDTTTLKSPPSNNGHSDEQLCARRLVDEVADGGFQQLDALLVSCGAASQREVPDICRAILSAVRSKPLTTSESLTTSKPVTTSEAARVSAEANDTDTTTDAAGESSFESFMEGSPQISQLVSAGDDINAAYVVIDELLASGDQSLIAAVLQHADVAKSVKSELLIAFVDERRKLPNRCEWILECSDAVDAGESLLARLIANFDWKELNEIVDGLPLDSLDSGQIAGLCRTLAGAAKEDAAKGHTFSRLIDDERMNDVVFLTALRTSASTRRAVFDVYPESEHGLEHRLVRGWLNRLPSETRFSDALDVLLDACSFLSENSAARIQGWARVRHYLDDISTKKDNSSDALRRLAEAANAALPVQIYPEDVDGSTRASLLAEAGQRLHGGGAISRQILSELETYFANTQ